MHGVGREHGGGGRRIRLGVGQGRREYQLSWRQRGRATGRRRALPRTRQPTQELDVRLVHFSCTDNEKNSCLKADDVPRVLARACHDVGESKCQRCKGRDKRICARKGT
jgi:hypothetical protein